MLISCKGGGAGQIGFLLQAFPKKKNITTRREEKETVGRHRFLFLSLSSLKTCKWKRKRQPRRENTSVCVCVWTHNKKDKLRRRRSSSSIQQQQQSKLYKKRFSAAVACFQPSHNGLVYSVIQRWLVCVYSDRTATHRESVGRLFFGRARLVAGDQRGRVAVGEEECEQVSPLSS